MSSVFILLHIKTTRMLDNATDIANGSVTEHSDLEVKGYRLVHGYISGTICFLGVLFNVCNVAVWSQRALRTSTSLLLTTLSVADGCSVFMYLLYVTYYFTATGPSELIYHSRAGMYLVVICFHQFIAFHTFSNWITISLAIFRYLKVCHPKIGKKICTRKRALLTIGIVFVATTLASSPFYLYYEVYDLADHLSGYWIRKTSFAVAHVDYQTTLAWLYGVIFKVGPCLAMIILCSLIARNLYNADKRRGNMAAGIDSNENRISSGYSRTTKMLIIIVVIYVVTELPIGAISFVSGLQYSESHFFYFLLYSYVGDLLDTLTVINGSVNLIVYVTMSRQYRLGFKRTVLGRYVKKYAVTETVETGYTNDTNNHELSQPSLDLLSRDLKDKISTTETDRGVIVTSVLV